MSQTINPFNQQTGIYNALVPPEGPKSVNIPLDFSENAAFLIDFTLAYMKTSLSVVQTLWIDNFANDEPVLVSVDNTGQTIEVPASSQGSFPVIAAIRPKITVASAGTALVKTLWLNVPLPGVVWYASGATTVTLGGVGIRDNSLEVLPPLATAAAGAATVVTTGGTAVTVFPASTIIQQGLITNPFDATESLFVDIVNAPGTTAPGTNGTTFELTAGATFVVPPITNLVRANAATSGHVFTAVRT